MARPLKWILGIVGGLIILVIVAVVVVVSSYDLKPLISKAVHDATGRDLVINSEIKLDIGLSPSLVISDISFRNADWGSRKEMIKLSRFEVKIALLPLIKKNIEVKRFIIKDPDILIETDKNGKANFEFDTPAKTPVTENKPSETKQAEGGDISLPSLTVNEFEIINGTLTYKDGQTGKTETIKLKDLKAGIRGIDNPFTIDLAGSYNDNTFEVSGTLGSINGINDPAIEWPIDINAKAFGVNSSIKGSIKNPVEQKGIKLDFNVKIDSWDKLSGIAGQEIPVKDPLSVSGNITDSAPQSYQISGLKISLGKNQIEASIGINLAGAVPFIDASLSSKELDLNALIPQDNAPEKSIEKTEQAVSAKEDEKMFPDDPLPLDSLKLVDGKFRIRFDKIIVPKMVVNNLAIDATMKNGNLFVKPFKADVGGGSVSVEMGLAPKEKVADLTTIVNIKDLKLADLLADAGTDYAMEGKVNADIDIKGNGDSVAAIMAGLNGFSRIIMSDGKIDNKIIDKIGGDTSKNIVRLLNPSIDEKQYTAIRCMVTRFDISDGIADATAFALDTSMMSIIGEGNINLKTERLNLSLAPSTKGGVAGYNLSLGELSRSNWEEHLLSHHLLWIRRKRRPQ